MFLFSHFRRFDVEKSIGTGAPSIILIYFDSIFTFGDRCMECARFSLGRSATFLPTLLSPVLQRLKAWYCILQNS